MLALPIVSPCVLTFPLVCSAQISEAAPAIFPTVVATAAPVSPHPCCPTRTKCPRMATRVVKTPEALPVGKETLQIHHGELVWRIEDTWYGGHSIPTGGS